ncbi:FIG061771: ATP-dependent nuclease subunit A [hydrothermal vent metagenome]|uniref:DNA 3'-5' helicase n=1 Tax=hydrothermal vent metagenome TaxID=652676 RepID=A0A3B0T179_9ZZZZ
MTDKVLIIEAGPEQARAASPESIVWVSANAGSGKTHVLVDRLARLLLGGTPPGRILCLTFTNAAAAEMANRLFGRLASWAMADDETLTAILKGLTGKIPGAAELTRARKLFALALESPGGLKIHTIHGFCTQVLQRFPLEANVAPNFIQLDERGTAEILADIREALMAEAADAPDGPLGRALGTVSTGLHDMGLDDFFSQFLKRRDLLAAAGAGATVEAALEALAATFGASAEAGDEEKILNTHFGARFDRKMARQAADHMATGKNTDIKLAPLMGALAQSGSPRQAYLAHEAVFLTKSDKKVRAHAMTKGLREDRPDLAEWTAKELARAGELRRLLDIARTLAATRAALVLGHRVVTAYEAAKRARTLLDYDDLILKTRQLLSRSSDAQWVLYKLDGGIDHILVDEAQDTSAEQWDIVCYLAEDMLSGQGAGDGARTVFAVGDEKQSIFSFQGADPAMFDRMRQHFAGRAEAAELLWDAVPLEDSFRSTREILAAVDAVFAAETAASGLSASGAPVHHNAKRAAPGMVEIWPPAEIDEAAAPDPWTVPVDHLAPGSSQLVLARQIADQIATWLDEGHLLSSQGRKIRPGDIMILVRRRNAFVEAVVRELKARGVPVAGIDRMKLTEQIVVEDLMALGRFAALPDDDLTLGALLKSPLIGLTEDELFELAWNREGSLWRALRHHADERQTPAMVAARDTLAAALALADRVPPYEFFSDFLCAPGRREAIHARLGIEADDPINEFLAAALGYEAQETPTLDGFLAWLGRGEMEIKRDMEHGKDEVRVMTVHGAKGLEAKIVFLPDTCSGPGGGNRFTLYDVKVQGTDIKLPVWSRARAGTIAAIDAARELKANKEAEEYRRLLYVAMTRACDWLIVAGYGSRRSKTPPSGCWYDLVREGMAAHFDGKAQDMGQGRLRYVLPRRDGGGDMSQVDEALRGVTEAGTPPDWAYEMAARPVPAAQLTPSIPADADAGAPVAITPLDQIRHNRFRRGTLIHGLLEILPALPPAERQEGVASYLEATAADLDENLAAELAAEAIAVLAAPGFAPFLSPEAHAEVPFSAMIETPDRPPIPVIGQVDRLAFIGTTLHVLDYKTHRPAPVSVKDVPAATLRQMALYRAALGQIFPAKTVEVSILWTNHARLMQLPHEVLDDALAKAVADAPSP